MIMLIDIHMAASCHGIRAPLAFLNPILITNRMAYVSWGTTEIPPKLAP